MESDFRACSECGAANPATAEWCGQCYTPFAGDPAGESEMALKAVEPMAVSAELVEQNHEVEGRGGPSWVCRVCDRSNPVEESVCASCGVSIFESLTPPEAAKADPQTIFRRGLLVPGWGYAAVGQAAFGVVAGFLALAGLVSGLAMVFTGLFLGVIPILVAFGIWAASAADASRIGAGHVPMLTPRMLSVAGGVVAIVLLITIAQAFGRATG